MGTLAQPRQNSASRTRKSPRREQDLCRRMREALVMLGGEAHRTTVIEAVAKEFGLDVRHIPDDLQLAMIMAFEGSYRDDAQREAYGFYLKFGEGSHRWAVKLDDNAQAA
jgi:hypothetical protein